MILIFNTDTRLVGAVGNEKKAVAMAMQVMKKIDQSPNGGGTDGVRVLTLQDPMRMAP